MDRIFISYAREDLEFVQRLYGALEERGRKAWVDWEGIPPTDKWLARIRSAIDEADAFVFVISPASVASQVCQTELNHAIRQHKRLVPLVHREPAPGTVRPELAELNYIFARDADSFEAACDRLVSALDTDLEWVRAHTRLLVRAAEWEREGRDTSFMLRGRDLVDFEDWLARSPEKEPAPTALQTEYLLASRRTVTRRQRIIGTSVAVGLSLAVGLATIAYFQNRERVRQETIAEARQLLNRADALREGSLEETDVRGRLEESTRSAAAALATLHGLGIRSLEADQSVRRSYAALPKWVDFEMGPASIDASAFDPTGAHLALFRGGDELMVWDVARRQEAGSCAIPLESMQSAVGLAVSADGGVVATAVYDAGGGRGDTEVTVWSLAGCRRTRQVRVPGRRERVALGGGGAYLAVDAGSAVRIWEVASGSERFGDFADLVFAFAFDPEGSRLATVERDRGERRYWLRVRDLAGNGIQHEWELPERAASIRWSPHALVAAGQSALIYDGNGGELRQRHPLEGGAFALSPDGRLLAVSLPDYVIEIRDAATGATVARTAHGSEAAALAFAPDNGSLTAVSHAGRNIRLWFFEGDGAFATIHSPATPARLRFSGDGTYLHVETDQGSVAWRLPRPGEQSVARSPDAAPPGAAVGSYRVEFPQWAGCDTDSTTLALHDERSGNGPRTIGLDAAPLGAAVSREGDRLAVLVSTGSTRGGCGRRLEIWEVGRHPAVAARELEPLLDSEAAAFVRFVGGGRYLAVGVRDGVEVVGSGDLGPLATLYHAGVRHVAMQADGTLAATQGSDGQVRVWEMGTLSEIARIESAPTTAALALSPDDRWLTTLEPPDTIRLWALAPEDLIQQVCRWLAQPCP